MKFDVNIECGISQQAVRMIEERAAAGMDTYATTLQNNNTKTLDEWIDDVIEEQLDSIMYLLKLKEELGDKI